MTNVFNDYEVLPEITRRDGVRISVNRYNLPGGEPWWTVNFYDGERICTKWPDSEAKALAEAEEYLSDESLDPFAD